METQIVQISPEQLDQLFGENPDALPTADNLAVGKEEAGAGPENIPELPESLADEKVEESPVDATSESKDTIPELADDDLENILTDDSGEGGQISDVLTNTVDYLIKEGLWQDFEGREGLEITPEVWAELSATQAQVAATDMFKEMLDETGDYGKAIISHIRQGGDPNEIIDIFKEQKSINSIDTSTEDGKVAKIETYYKDVLGWKEDRVRRHKNRIIENDEVDEEFETIEEAYQKHYEDKIQATQQKQREQEQARIDAQKKFVNSIKDVLDGDTRLTNKEKQIIASSILDFKHTLDNGQKVNDFYLRFAEVQSNPAEYVELVQFIMNKESYLKKLQKKEETNANKKVFEFIKNNKAITSSKSQNINIKRDDKKSGTDFSFYTKK